MDKPNPNHLERLTLFVYLSFVLILMPIIFKDDGKSSLIRNVLPCYIVSWQNYCKSLLLMILILTKADKIHSGRFSGENERSHKTPAFLFWFFWPQIVIDFSKWAYIKKWPINERDKEKKIKRVLKMLQIINAILRLTETTQNSRMESKVFWIFLLS